MGEEMTEVTPLVESAIGEMCNVVAGRATLLLNDIGQHLDITPPGVNKGEAVQHLASQYEVDLSEVAVIGDGEVDVPMFLVKGVTSIAMGNAPACAVRLPYASVKGGAPRAA